MGLTKRFECIIQPPRFARPPTTGGLDFKQTLSKKLSLLLAKEEVDINTTLF